MTEKKKYLHALVSSMIDTSANNMKDEIEKALNCPSLDIENFDPESSQGNNNMGGSFERFSMPQTTSYGFGVDLKF